jgi:hypothetical protein
LSPCCWDIVEVLDADADAEGGVDLLSTGLAAATTDGGITGYLALPDALPAASKELV